MAPQADMINLYTELDVEPGTSPDAIKKSYRKLVLKYHPDKNPQDVVGAEERIRRINNAYETLSNPAKRAGYDAQLRSMQMKRGGMRVDTSMIRPRMQIPKAFMLTPMGHPDKFLRGLGDSLAFHSREDVGGADRADFNSFFQVARFQLWWLPKVNNMCRLRSQPLAAVSESYRGGPPSGQVLSFGLSPGTQVSDVRLTVHEQAACNDVIAVASPEYAGAFRFEAAYFPGHFLSFDPPTRTQMMKPYDQFAVIDFMLVDFAVSEKFRTLDEVLVPAVVAVGGDKEPVKLTTVCQDKSIAAYFQVTMGGAAMDFTDFALYFHAHSDRWKYDESQQMLQMRGPQEKLGCALSRAQKLSEAIRLLSQPTQLKVEWLPLEAIEKVLLLFSEARPAGAGPSSTAANSELKKLITILKDMCLSGHRVILSGLPSLWGILSKLEVDNSIEQLLISDTLDAIVQRSSKLLRAEDTALDLKSLTAVFDMPLCWEESSEALSQKVQQLIGRESLDTLVPLMKKVAGVRGAGKFGECLATTAMMKIFGAPPAIAIEALDAMARGGFGLDGVPMMLKMLLPRIEKEAGARVLAGLAERGLKGPDLDTCWEAILEKSALESLPAALLVRLATLAVAPSPNVPGAALGSICEVIQPLLGCGPFSFDEAMDLLPAIFNQGASAAAARPECEALIVPVMDCLKSKFGDLPPSRSIDAMIVISKIDACGSLLEVAADCLVRTSAKADASQLLSLTKALLPLGPSNPALQKIVECWRVRLLSAEAKATEAEAKVAVGDKIEVHGLSSEKASRLNGCTGTVKRWIAEKGRFEVYLNVGFSGGETVSLQPKNFRRLSSTAELPDDLSGDRLAEIFTLLSSVSTEQDERGALQVIADMLLDVGQLSLLTSAGLSWLSAALSAGKDGASFQNRQRLVEEVQRALESRSGGRSRSRSRGRK